MSTTKSNELIQVVETSGLEQQTANTLKDRFLPFFTDAEEWKKKADSLVVTDASQVREMNMAREARLALKAIRVNADKTRKELKEDSLRYGRAVQGVYNVIEFLIVPIEQHLEKQEKFVEIQEAARKDALRSLREEELAPYSEFVVANIDLGSLSDDDYAKMLNGAKLQLQAQKEAAKKAEEERIAREKAEAEERERIRKENEALKLAAEKREKELAEERAKAEKERAIAEEKARKEREAAQKALEKERAEKAKLEAEVKAKADAEEKAKREAQAKAEAEEKARLLAEKNAKNAPDKAKLEALAKLIDEISMPEVKGAEAQKIVTDVSTLLTKVTTFIREKSSAL